MSNIILQHGELCATKLAYALSLMAMAGEFAFQFLLNTFGCDSPMALTSRVLCSARHSASTCKISSFYNRGNFVVQN